MDKLSIKILVGIFVLNFLEIGQVIAEGDFCGSKEVLLQSLNDHRGCFCASSMKDIPSWDDVVSAAKMTVVKEACQNTECSNEPQCSTDCKCLLDLKESKISDDDDKYFIVRDFTQADPSTNKECVEKCDEQGLKSFQYIYDILKYIKASCGCTCQKKDFLLYPLDNCDEPKTNPVEPNQSTGSIQVENLMDGSCQSLIISQPTLSTGDSNAISLPSSNSLKSVSLAPPYDSSPIQISEAGAIINLTPLFGRGKTMNINFELNSPAEANTVIAVTCPCPLDVKLSSFKAALEAAKEQVALTWEIIEGNNAYLNIWGAQVEANEFKNVTQFNTQPILIDETIPLMNFSLATNQLNLGATYFALESVDYNGECVTYCDDIDAVVLGPVEVDLESVRNLCNLEMKRQIAAFGNTGSCVK